VQPPQDDLDRIMQVMAAAFDPAFGEAWTRRQVADSLMLGHTSYELIGADAKTPSHGEPAAGFMLVRHGYEEDELLLIGVNPAMRRCGLGGRLLSQLAVASRQRGASRILLEMRRGNPAEALYRRHGFLQIGSRPEYYRTAGNQRLDAITFALALD
jgi:[ribosomal protein S18]-alanine N-acetyltransferase